MIAAASNGGGYANQFQDLALTQDGGILASVLKELWDFDTRISTDGHTPPNPAPQDYLQIRPGYSIEAFRGYYQLNRSTPPGPQNNFAVSLPAGRWGNYHTPIPNEKPLLPPGPYNDTNSTDTPGGISFTHHLIRDFMFLDAAVNNNIDLLSSLTPAWPTTVFPYDVAQRDLDTSGNVGKYTQGNGYHSDTYYLLNDSSGVPDDGTPLNFESRNIGFTALLYELRNSGAGGAATDVPNWFGVAVPDGITDFRNVIIYFHPSPQQSGANYSTLDYQDKSGAHGTNWKELFAYVERLGKQLAGAAKYSTGTKDLRNQIVIVPFMKEYDKVGVLPRYWPFIVRAILDDLYANRASFL